ncbi:uncharacterized protein VP01_3344g1 [Puccinia sorghi]|uniref:Uncharacterized protein n=1 Tax=Puccinia sorghi TaxID=27349 RepID=A0A0L6UYZ0_9BASI|nr:uncharacterized protein VP01_3344g1 [Puccinia sorghi]
MAYTQQFNSQVYESGWDNMVLILYRNGLKENIQIGIVLSGQTFAKLPNIHTLAIQLSNEIEANPTLLTRLTTIIPPPQQNFQQ